MSKNEKTLPTPHKNMLQHNCIVLAQSGAFIADLEIGVLREIKTGDGISLQAWNDDLTAKFNSKHDIMEIHVNKVLVAKA